MPGLPIYPAFVDGRHQEVNLYFPHPMHPQRILATGHCNHRANKT